MDGNISAQEYYASPPFNGLTYSTGMQIYYLISGFLSTLGNLFLILVFILSKKLRQLQCNWFIVYLCFSNALVGFGTFARGILITYSINSRIIYLDFFLCTFLIPIPFSSGYRLAQVIALVIAIDRLIAIWKPVFYNKKQSHVMIISGGIISLISYGLFIMIALLDVKFVPLTLDKCLSPVSSYWYIILPTVSGIISIIFFAVYISSLVVFWNHVNLTQKHQTHFQSHMLKVQRKVFVTVSMALFSMTIFYVLPTILQLLCYYFNIVGWVYDASKMLIMYGAAFNACLNALIYLMKHNEFKSCSKQFILGCTGIKASIEVSHHTQHVKIIHRS